MVKRREHTEEAIRGIEDARRYADMHRRHAPWIYRAFLHDVKRLNISGACLEVGAGPGILAVMMAEQNPAIQITAVDLSADMATVAQEYIEQKGLEHRIRYRVLDVGDDAILRRLGRFDLAYSTFSMHHWRDPAASIRSLWEALGEGGIVYVHDMKRVWWSWLLPLGTGDKKSIRASYTPKEIEGFLQAVGIPEYEITTLFPFFLQSVIVRK